MTYYFGQPVLTRRTLRPALLTTVACAGLIAASPVMAEGADPVRPNSGHLSASDSELAPHGDSVSVLGPIDRNRIEIAPQDADPLSAAKRAPAVSVVAPEPEILIANPGTPTTARDPVNINGVAQMIVDSGGGSVGLCTGSLINPRTVLFAAHCVNTRAATQYGAASGGTPIGFGFETNLRANAPGEVDELIRWLFGGTGGAGRHQTNIAQAFYNVSQVVYNPLSLEPAARGFLYGDVALATLDTPAANIPTWALLFSPLTNTGTVTSAGTGFNVSIVGYGGNGTGTSGSICPGPGTPPVNLCAIDFRRRAAENILGALTDLQTFEQFLFGGAPSGLTQNLYFLDFDDPLRGQAGASPFDFNAFRDPARITNGAPTEGITAPGDSGGPLIVQNFSKQLVIGVLSGGYTRFFNGQPANGYGTVNFYQPLYLYWDWIAGNNPYHYVTTRAGDGSWTDGNHWLTTLDPAYNVLSGTTVVNGIPSVLGQQKAGGGGDFGQICFQFGGGDECYDTRTGEFLVNGQVVATGPTPAVDPTTGLPAATLANGLPGATGFVPNNVDPVRTTGARGQYFDVTLTAAGTTTLSGANVVIDRLTLGGAQSNLVVASGASLTTLINTGQFAGVNTVNGTFNSVGDYSLMGGALMGSGRVNAPFVTSMMGRIAPGTMGTTGTLIIGGNLILASGSQLLIDLAAGGVSDRVAVVAGSGQAGLATLGGTIGFQTVGGYRPRDGDLFTIVTAAGGLTGTFSQAPSFSAILTPKLNYTANAVQLEIEAGLYADAINPASPIQSAYAGLLDANRGNYNALSDVYGELDLLGTADLQGTLETLAPSAAQLSGNIGLVLTDTLSRFYRDRMGTVARGGTYGSIAMYGRPIQLASLATTSLGGAQVQSDSGNGMMLQEGALPDDLAVYLAGGYVEGSGRGLPGAQPAQRNRFDGYYIAGGIEKDLGGGTLGIGISYADIDGRVPGGAQLADATLYQGTLYGTLSAGSGVVLDGVISVGSYDSNTQRSVSLGALPFTLRAKDQTTAVSAEIGLGGTTGTEALSFVPRVALRYNLLDFDDVQETGGGPALRYNLGKFESWQARGGVTLNVGSGAVRPFASAQYVHDFGDRPGVFGANFAGGIGPDALFALAGTDRDWGEVAGGLTINQGNIAASFSAETTVNRADVRNQAYRASITVRF